MNNLTENADVFDGTDKWTMQEKINFIVQYRRLGCTGPYFDRIEQDVLDHLKKIESAKDRIKQLPTALYSRPLSKLKKQMHPFFAGITLKRAVDWTKLVPTFEWDEKTIEYVFLDGKTQEEVRKAGKEWNKEFDKKQKEKKEKEQ